MTPWRSFEISRRFATHHAESLAANRWLLRHSDHKEVTKESAHWTPLMKDTYNGISQWNRKVLKRLYLKKENTFSHSVFSYVMHEVMSGHSAKSVCIRCQEGPIHDLLISIHKTRGFEWQTAHTKGCQENSCGLFASTDLWPQDFFLECLRWSSLKVVSVPTSVTIGGLRGSTATSDLVRCMCVIVVSMRGWADVGLWAAVCFLGKIS